MKLTKRRLRRIIKEVLSETWVIQTPAGEDVETFDDPDSAEAALDRGTGGRGAFVTKAGGEQF